MSPILANIYLNEAVDQWFVENYASYNSIIVRYADDAVFLFKKKEEAEAFLNDLQLRVEKFGLSLNMDKSHTVDLKKSGNNDIDFLGFTFYWGEKKKFRTPSSENQDGEEAPPREDAGIQTMGEGKSQRHETESALGASRKEADGTLQLLWVVDELPQALALLHASSS